MSWGLFQRGPLPQSHQEHRAVSPCHCLRWGFQLRSCGVFFFKSFHSLKNSTCCKDLDGVAAQDAADSGICSLSLWGCQWSEAWSTTVLCPVTAGLPRVKAVTGPRFPFGKAGGGLGEAMKGVILEGADCWKTPGFPLLPDLDPVQQLLLSPAPQPLQLWLPALTVSPGPLSAQSSLCGIKYRLQKTDERGDSPPPTRFLIRTLDRSLDRSVPQFVK